MCNHRSSLDPTVDQQNLPWLKTARAACYPINQTSYQEGNPESSEMSTDCHYLCEFEENSFPRDCLANVQVQMSCFFRRTKKFIRRLIGDKMFIGKSFFLFFVYQFNKVYRFFNKNFELFDDQKSPQQKVTKQHKVAKRLSNSTWKGNESLNSVHAICRYIYWFLVLCFNVSQPSQTASNASRLVWQSILLANSFWCFKGPAREEARGKGVERKWGKKEGKREEKKKEWRA